MMRSEGNARLARRSSTFAWLATVAALGVAAFADPDKPATTQATTAPAATTAATTAPAPLSPAEQKTVDAAVAALSADSWKERQAGQDALVALGEAAAPRLRVLSAKSDDEEVRTRADAALRQIEDNALIGPSVITLHLKNATPKDVFAEIGKQSRCEFPTYPVNLWQQNNGATNGSVTIDFDRANFWTVFKDACQKTGVGPQQFGNDRRMTLSQGTSISWDGPSYLSGPFLIVANRIQRTNAVDLANPANVQHDFSIGLSAFAEPKVRVIGSSYNVQVDKAVDENGNSLLSTDMVYNGFNSGSQWMWNLTARLRYPENAGKTIKQFKGTVKFLVQTKSETFDVADVLTAKNVTRTIGGRRMVLKEVKKNGEQYDVQLTMYRDGMGQNEWNQMQQPGYNAKLLDKQGRALNAQGYGSGGGGNEMTYNLNYSRNSWGGDDAKPGEPHRLVWEIPTETRDTNLTFEFKDLPLP